MPRRRVAICCLALVLALGNAAVVQAIGWTGMIASRSLDGGFAAAVASTFSGEAPCTLCRAAAAMDDRDAADRAAQVLKMTKRIDAQPSRRADPILIAMADVLLPVPAARVRPTCVQPAPEPPPPRS